MTESLLQIANHHDEACGQISAIPGDDPTVYIGYFENAYGEQWVFTFNRQTRLAELRGGDIGWERVYAVENGYVDVIISAAEEAWLDACWAAATRR